MTPFARGVAVSVQAERDSPMNAPEMIAAMARAAVRNGAVAIRAEGLERIAAVRRAVDVPVIGLVKRVYAGFGPYITPTAREIAEVAAAGAHIIALDATRRPRPDGSSFQVAAGRVRAHGASIMADCADARDVRAAMEAGADIIATTLCGYTEATRGTPLPAFDLVYAIASSGATAVCEGGVSSPDHVREAFASGAYAVVVGTAITNVDVLARRFTGAVPP